MSGHGSWERNKVIYYLFHLTHVNKYKNSKHKRLLNFVNQNQFAVISLQASQLHLGDLRATYYTILLCEYFIKIRTDAISKNNRDLVLVRQINMRNIFSPHRSFKNKHFKDFLEHGSQNRVLTLTSGTLEDKVISNFCLSYRVIVSSTIRYTKKRILLMKFD